MIPEIKKEFQDLIPFVDMFVPINVFQPVWNRHDWKYGYFCVFYNKMDDVYMVIVDWDDVAPVERLELINTILQKKGYEPQYDMNGKHIYINYNGRQVIFKPYQAKGFIMKCSSNADLMVVINTMVGLYRYDIADGFGLSDMDGQFVYFHSSYSKHPTLRYETGEKVAHLLLQYHEYVDYEFIYRYKQRLKRWYRVKMRGHNIHVKAEYGKCILIPICYDYAIEIKEEY